MKLNYRILIPYILTLALFCAFAVIYEQPLLVLFIFMLIIPIPFSVGIFISAVSKYHFSLNALSEYVEEPNPPTFVFKYNSDAHIGLFTGDLEFYVSNRYYPNETKHILSIPLIRKSNSFSIPIESYEIGLITLKATKIVLHDYLSLITKEIDLSTEASVPILPVDRHINDFPPAVPKDGPDEYTESENIGNISSDVKEIREYRPGDRLQRIHWKLSAKLDDLFVKEMAHTSSLAIILLPELTKDKIHDTSETLLSCIKAMNEKKERFEVCIYNDKLCDYSFFTITDDEGIVEIMTHFYCQPLYEGNENALNTFTNSSNKIATIIHISGKRIKMI